MSFRSVLKSEGFLTLPGAHDAISARLIERAGFKAYFIGGFPLVGARFGVPDVGLAQLGEISEAARDIVAACPLPVMMDCDNGYGDTKNAVYTLHAYERLGISAMMFEDQVAPKRCGHLAGKDVVPAEHMIATIKAVTQNRLNKDTFILARTDARSVVSMDEALRRGEQYIRAGADGVFVESPHNVAELEQIGKAFDVPQMANMAEGGRTPILPPNELKEMGFEMAVYGLSLLMHAVHRMQGLLAQLAANDISWVNKGVSFPEYHNIVGMDAWSKIEDTYRVK